MADPAPQNPKPPGEPSPAPGPEAMAEAALSAAQDAVSTLKQTAGVGGGAPGDGSAQRFEPQPLSRAEPHGVPKGMDLLSDVNLNVKIELGRTRMLVEDVLRLNEGAVVELDKLAGDPVDVYVNDRHIARGEVLVLNDNFCVRINEIINQIGDGEQPAKSAG